MWIKFFMVVLLTISEIEGAADYDVEQIKSPYVDLKDTGTRMSMTSSNRHSSQHESGPYVNQRNRLHGCVACQYGTTGTSGSSYSSNYQSPGPYRTYSTPVKMSSSQHEFKEKQEFVNGQQVYDFHQEKEYKDGNLVKNKIREKSPDDFGVNSYSQGSTAFGSSLHGLENYGSSPYDIPKTAGSSFTSSSQSRYNTLPQRSHGVTFESAPHSVSTKNYGSNLGNLDTEKFDSEIERLRKEMEMRTLSLHHDNMPAQLGGSHRTEVRTEMKYVNGKPIYIKNEERKYKDGKLIHNETNEKGAEDLGTAEIVANHKTFNSPTSVYSRQYEQQSNSQYPSTRYQGSSYSSGPYYSSSDARLDASNGRYQPASHVSTSQTHSPSSAGYALSSQQVVNHLPGKIYSTEIREEQGQTHTSADYKPLRRTVHSSNEPTGPAYPLNSQIITKPGTGAVYSTEIREEHETRTASGYNNPSSLNSETDYRYNSYLPKSSGIPAYRIPNTVRPSFQTSTLAPERSAATRKYDYNSSHTQDSASRQHKPIITNYDTDTGSAHYDRYAPRPQTSASSHYSSERNLENHRTYGQQPTALTTTTTTPRPASNNFRRPSSEDYTQDQNMVREASQTSYFNSRPSSTYYPSNYIRPEKIILNHREKAIEGTDFSQSLARSHSQTTEKEIKSQVYQPAIYSSSETTNGDKTRHISTNYYPVQYNHKFSTDHGAADGYGEDESSDDISHGRKDTDNTQNVVVPGVISGPQASRYPYGDEHERYDISPLIDGDESEIDTNEVPGSGENISRPRPIYNNKHEPAPGTHQHASNHYYEQSKQKKAAYKTRPIIIPQTHYDQHSRSVLTNSSTLPDIRTINAIPSIWVETRTKRKYFNGKLVTETQYSKYYENGILIHDNSTEKTRDQLAAEGVDVHQLDLSASQLADYGPVVKSSTHSQSHEVTHVQRFRNGQPIYELNHDKRFQDGQLVHENREEKDENDFTRESGNLMNANRRNKNAHGQHFYQQFLAGGSDIPALSSDLLQTQDLTLNPSGYVRKHEVRQEEEFVNGQKVYNLFHEKEYKDGNLIRENKTELGPEDLRAQSNDALKDLREGRTHSHTGQETLHQQIKTNEDILSTQCLTCRDQLTSSGGSSSGSYASGSHSTSVLGSLGIPAEHAHSSAATFKHDVNVEEHYENGKMVKGREDTRKWKDGRLVDSKTEHYYDGSSRTNLDLSGSPLYGGGSALTLSGTPEANIGSEYNSCSYNSCLNGADCRKSGNTQVCICKLGFKGLRCDEVYCPVSFCRYGGSCSASSGTQICSCPSGYTGYRCSTRIHSIRIGG